MIRFKIVLLSLGLLFVVGCKGSKPEEVKDSVQTPERSVAYYFHTKVRCASCYAIENYAKQVFCEDFAQGLRLEMVNVENAENRHFITDYQLYTKSIVLVKIKNGKKVAYKNLSKIWNYLGDEVKFKSYLRQEIKNFLLK